MTYVNMDQPVNCPVMNGTYRCERSQHHSGDHMGHLRGRRYRFAGPYEDVIFAKPARPAFESEWTNGHVTIPMSNVGDIQRTARRSRLDGRTEVLVSPSEGYRAATTKEAWTFVSRTVRLAAERIARENREYDGTQH